MSAADIRYYIGVDVGTSSVRAALISENGHFIQKSIGPIEVFSGIKADHYEQSSNNIWDAVTLSVRNLMEMCGVNANAVYGIGFDATCSLVVMDESFTPLPVGLQNAACDIVMWMDHRATRQAEQINSTKSQLLRSVGDSISVEMQLPKLLWIKENLKDQCWDKACHFFDLPDFLTWRATGCLSRSACSVVCKWLYGADNSGWSADFMSQIGLADLTHHNFSKIGNVVLSPGEPCGSGLTEEEATKMGLNPGTAVATSMIDAYAGCLGTISCDRSDCHNDVKSQLTERLAMICGTSTCHLTVSEEAVYVAGVWGPFHSVIFTGLWTSEAGQSAAGSLLNHVITTHPAYGDIKQLAEQSGKDISEHLNQVLETMRQTSGLSSVALLTKHLHSWPDYHGNRSPLADDSITGMLCGLRLTRSVDDLASTYLATVQALAYGTRHILDKMGEKGRHFKVITMCGGLSKNGLYVRMHADVTGLPVVVPHAPDTVLLGSAMLAAKACGHVPTLQEAMEKMSGSGDVCTPNAQDKCFHDKKYEVFLAMIRDQMKYRDTMNGAGV